jgi:retron-type reverse transcriptase
VTLNAASLNWAIDFVAVHSDGDLFPRILEVEAIQALQAQFVELIENKPLANFDVGAHRRFIVPKDEISYRQATQLHPQDSILLSAVVHQFGQGVEARRLPQDRVFSYRFAPSSEHGLYATQGGWNNFWRAAHQQSFRCATILYCDIADFYNQVSHHAVENQLFASGFPNQAVRWVIKLVESTTAGVSRGIPIGPHGTHLIAEATLIPVDNSMSSSGLGFLRYADDIVVFCDSDRAARQALAVIASILDKQQRLILQRHKTRFFSPAEFRDLCNKMIEDRPISDNEDRLLQLIKKYSGDDPYKSVSYEEISQEDWKKITNEIVDRIIREYIGQSQVDYVRLRWFYRRLSQIGHPGAIDISLNELEKLGPCFANICTYFSSVQAIDPERWKGIGARLLDLLDSDNVKNNEFFRLSILSLFSRNAYIDHFNILASRFQASDPSVRREIFLAAKKNGAVDWLREHKESFGNMDPWQRMAFLYCCADLPVDEKKYYINRWVFDCPFDIVLAKWAKSNASSKA